MQKLYQELQESYGTHFQDIFSQIMKQKYRDQYYPTQNYGNMGDMKVDGILNNTIAFAVYAPETVSQSNTIKKFNSDLEGFITKKELGNWEYVNTWIFVFKSNRKGVPPLLLNKVLQENENINLNIKIWTMEDIFLEISSYMVPELPYKIKSDICANINYLKSIYFKLYNEYISMHKNPNILFKKLELQSNYETQKFDDFYSIFNSYISLCKIRQDYYNHLDEYGCGKYIDELEEIRPPFAEKDLIVTIYEGFQSIVDEEKHKRRIELCDLILNSMKL